MGDYRSTDLGSTPPPGVRAVSHLTSDNSDFRSFRHGWLVVREVGVACSAEGAYLSFDDLPARRAVTAYVAAYASPHSFCTFTVSSAGAGSTICSHDPSCHGLRCLGGRTLKVRISEIAYTVLVLAGLHTIGSSQQYGGRRMRLSPTRHDRDGHRERALCIHSRARRYSTYIVVR